MSSALSLGRPLAIEPPRRSARRRGQHEREVGAVGPSPCRDVGAKRSNANGVEDGRIAVTFEVAGYRTPDLAACLVGYLLAREA